MKDSSLLGIDISDSELRVVYTRPKNGKPCVYKVGSVGIPAGSFAHGQIQHSGSIALALRRLLDTMGARTDQAVFGVNSDRVASRAISVPPVPDSELAAVVAVEVDHYHVVQNPGGAHAFIRLHSPRRGNDAEPIQVVTLGVEAETTEAIRDLASRAGLKTVAVEPNQLAMLRTAALGFPSSATAFALLVSGLSTDAVFLVDGNVIAFRKLDVGARAMSTPVMPRVAPAHTSFFDRAEDGSPLPEAAPYVDPDSVDRLALEAKRTLDYLQREFPDFAVVDRVHIVTDRAELSGLGSMLSERLGIPAELVRAPAGGSDSPEASVELSGDQGLRYVTAFGLGMIDAPVPSAKLPRVDLFSTQRTAAAREVTKRNFLGAIVVSVLGVLVGVAGYVLFSTQIAQIDDETKTTSAQTAAINDQTNQTVEERIVHAKQYKSLRKEGVPLGVIMDYLVASIEPGVGLKTVVISPNLKVDITGEALDEAAMIRTSQNLQKSPVLKDLMVNSFQRGDKATGDALSFTLSATTVPASKVKLPEEPKGAAPSAVKPAPAGLVGGH